MGDRILLIAGILAGLYLLNSCTHTYPEYAAVPAAHATEVNCGARQAIAVQTARNRIADWMHIRKERLFLHGRAIKSVTHTKDCKLFIVTGTTTLERENGSTFTVRHDIRVAFDKDGNEHVVNLIFTTQ